MHFVQVLSIAVFILSLFLLLLCLLLMNARLDIIAIRHIGTGFVQFKRWITFESLQGLWNRWFTKLSFRYLCHERIQLVLVVVLHLQWLINDHLLLLLLFNFFIFIFELLRKPSIHHWFICFTSLFNDCVVTFAMIVRLIDHQRVLNGDWWWIIMRLLIATSCRCRLIWSEERWHIVSLDHWTPMWGLRLRVFIHAAFINVVVDLRLSSCDGHLTDSTSFPDLVGHPWADCSTISMTIR